MKKIILSISLSICFWGTIPAQLTQFTSSSDWHPGFIKNEGQFLDQHGRMNESVKYMYVSGNFHLQLKENGFSYELLTVSKEPVNLKESTGTHTDSDNKNTTVSASRIDVRFKGASGHPVLQAEDQSQARHHYYLAGLSDGGVTNVSSFNRIIYQNLYPGIDLVFEFDQNNPVSPLEYSFILHPGAQASNIKMQYSGATGILLSETGDLTIGASQGQVDEKNLLAFSKSTGNELPVKRIISGNTIGFQLKSSSSDTRVIDPNIIWSSYYGGTALDYIGEVAGDNSTHQVFGGTTESTTNIATSGAYQETYAGNSDLIAGKFDVNGQLMWATYLGGNDIELGYGVTTDASDNIILAAKSQSGMEITTTGAWQETSGGGGDMCAAKFDPDGLLLWCTLLGEYAPENFRQPITDADNNIYICGYTESDSVVKISTKNPSVYEGEGDAFVIKFSPNGIPSWSAYIGGNGQDRAHGLSFDQFGNIYLEGTTESDLGLSTPGAFQVTYGGNTDAFISKLDSTGNEIWTTYYGGTAEDHGRGVVCDMKSRIYVTGYGRSGGVYGTPGTYQPNINSDADSQGNYSEDGFIGKFNYDGARIWGSYYGGGDPDQLLSISLDYNRSIFVCGVTASADSISTPTAFQKHKVPFTNDGYFGIFDSIGLLSYGTYLGGTDNERIEDIDYGQSALLYLAVVTFGPMPVTPGVWQTTNMGEQEAVIYRFGIAKTCTDVYEPNQNQGAAFPLESTNDTALYGYTASIKSANDSDWFSTETTELEPNLTIVLTDLTQPYSIMLYNVNGDLIGMSEADSTGDQVLHYNDTTGATYYFQVSHIATDFDSVKCYRLKVLKSNIPVYTGTGNYSSPIKIEVSPNPASDEIRVSGVAQVGDPVDVIIYNLLNEVVLRQTIPVTQSGFSQQIMLPGLAAGTYVIECIQGKTVHRQKIVVGR